MMHPSAQRVQNALIEAGADCQVMELEASTRTALEAAQAVGCEVGQIVKSLIFVLESDGNPDKAVLILVSGTNRVHEKHLGRLLGGTMVRPDADYVRDVTGFAIGGVPPFGHKTPLMTFIDEDLLQYDTIWAAAGTHNALFPIRPPELVRISGAQTVSVK
jgi:prolyl-tRNA editing enzyme YbaK/EbsC (Cys-tRNA(Pro) deacylase)